MKRPALSLFVLFCFLAVYLGLLHAGQEYFPGGSYDSKVPAPKQIIGHEIGEELTDHLAMEAYIKAVAAASDRVKLYKYGASYEGRNMYLLAVSAPENIARLDAILADNARLRDPRATSEAQAEQVIAANPIVVWLNYGNDGNEAAAFEAAIQVLYQLAAGTDPLTLEILGKSVAVINPCHNPDSHQRYVTWYRAAAINRRGTLDPNSFEHGSDWLMDTNNNHYQVDLNRDAFALTQIETQAVAAELYRWNPQVFVDFHSGPDNYFFPPYAIPINSNLPESNVRWARTIGESIAEDFAKNGWTFFTGEVFDIFYPGYWDSYPSLNGAIGMTYEVEGASSSYGRERSDGSIVRLRDGVERHFTASMATLRGAARNREAMLRDYYRFRKSGMEEAARGAVKQYLLLPGRDPGKTADLVELLIKHGIEVYRAAEKFSSRRARGYFHNAPPAEFPAGSYLIPAAQPQARLLKALLEPDPDQGAEFIAREKAKRERNKRLGLYVRGEQHAFYDVTAWSLPLAYGVEAYMLEDQPQVKSERLSSRPTVEGGTTGRARYGYIFSYETEAASRLLAQLLAADFKAAVATQDFRAGGTEFKKGALLLRVERNRAELHQFIAERAQKLGVRVYAVDSAWTESGPALGSASFVDLQKPRIAVAFAEPTAQGSVSSIWFILDQELGIPFTALAVRKLRTPEIYKYNVIVLPDGSPEEYREMLGEPGLARLKEWLKSGGTLVAIKRAAAFAAMKGVELTTAEILSPFDEQADKQDKEKKEEERKKIEAVFTPGAILRVNLNNDYYLGYGCDKEIATMKFSPRRWGGAVPVDLVLAPARKGANLGVYPEERLRLAGFMWEEAEKNLAGTAYLVVEPIERGQVILFADDPNFRLYWRGLRKLFLNSLLLAPGFAR